jgi:hypothetical protein
VLTGICGYKMAYRYDLPLGDCTVAMGAGLLLTCAALAGVRKLVR